MRKLATIRKIDRLSPIAGADKIELAHTGGWQCVVGKGQFKEGELAVFFEIDSALPANDERFAFLKDRCYKKWCLSDGTIVDECIRIKTARFKGEISQGLFMPMSDFEEELRLPDADFGFDMWPSEGTDVSDELNVRHFDEIAEVALQKTGKCCIAGNARGSFPSHLIPKTDEERLQNLTKYFTDPVISDMEFECTEKFDGSSVTFLYAPSADPEQPFHVCSRNLDLKESEDNIFWKMARKYDIEKKLAWAYEEMRDEIGIQAELVGPGVNGNKDQYTDHEIRVFRIRDIRNNKWLTSEARYMACKLFDLPHVKVFNEAWKVFKDFTCMEEFLEFVKGKTDRGHEREGMVWKSLDGTISFKVINNEYLLKQKD